MITNKPYFFDKFKCTADRCSDSCCIGWEIEIDQESLLRFKNEKGMLGQKLKDNISDVSFILTEDERCPFLMKNGLCELICSKDDRYICEICREHPRYHEWYGDHHDIGLGLCCEEACRLLFESDIPLHFVTESENEKEDGDDELITALLNEREKIYEILSDRTLSLSQRFARLPDCDIGFDEIIASAKSLEPFDERWSESFGYIRENYRELLHSKDDFLKCINNRVYEYESLALYLVHRYFMKAYSEYFADSVLRGIAAYMGIQLLFDLYIFRCKGKFELSDRIESAKYISKQIEYSEENIDIIMNL